MSDSFWLAAVLLGAPFGLLVAHAIVSRILRVCDVLIAPQLAVVGVVAVGNIPVVWLAWEWALKGLCQSPGDVVCGLLYVLMAYNGIGFCYFQVLNATETSLHVHILMELLLEGGYPSDELTRRYNAEDMVAARIDRMIALGQLRNRDGYFVLSNSTLLLVGRLIDMLRTFLGLPLAPEEQQDSPRDGVI